jgi:hypothetical protein
LTTYEIRVLTTEQATNAAKVLLNGLPEVDQLHWESFDIATDFADRPSGVYYTFSIPVPLGMHPEDHRQETNQLLGNLWADVETADRRDHTLVTIHEKYLKGKQP